jgi:two-component system LytT family response regulator
MKNNVTAIIVDDEIGGRKSVRNLLKLTDSPVDVLAEAGSVSEAIEKINSCKPQLIFLDIQLHKQTGFDMLDSLPGYEFEIIFITAYDHYAIDAFKRHAISYLLKPADPEEFELAVRRAATLIQSNTEKSQQQPDKYKQLLKGILPISKGSEIEYIRTSEVLYAKADGSYSIVHLKDGSNRMVSRNLKYLEDKLATENFVRVHRSYLVNPQAIDKYDKTGGGSLVLSDRTSIPVSNSGKQKLQEVS